MPNLACAVLMSVSLEAGFLNPPDSARPWTWWHWMNGHVTKEGITADLSAMKEIGLGGAQIFDAGLGNLAAGPVRFNSPAWFEALDHATREAKRLGLKIGVTSCSGWSTSGGPWIAPEQSMKVLGFTRTDVTGPVRFAGKLPAIPDPVGYRRDIAVFACRRPPAEDVSQAEAGGVVRTLAPNVRCVTFPKAFRANGFSARMTYVNTRDIRTWEFDGRMKVEASDDGERFRVVDEFQLDGAFQGHDDKDRRTFSFPKRTRARVFRFTWDFPAVARVDFADLTLEAGAAVPDLKVRTLGRRAPIRSNGVRADADQVVRHEEVVFLTESLSSDGKLDWQVPTGNWRIYRLSFAANGRQNHPATKGGRGLEVDKLSASAVNHHFDSYLGRLRGIDNVVIDSYEAGSQNWTESLPDEFRSLRGYDLKPYLPALTGVVVDSAEATERFLRDYRRTVSELFVGNYAKTMARRCHERGWSLALEPYGSCPSDDLEYGAAADIPMGECWTTGRPLGGDAGNARIAAYLAHVWGRPVAAMEAFTARPEGPCGRWQTTPWVLKTQCDRLYAQGINRIVYHRYVHQPWTGGKYVPGMTLGRYGMHFDRTQTWWREGAEWVKYQARCQWLLQQGRSVTDVLFFLGDDKPFSPDLGELLPKGYAWDVCSQDVLDKLTARGGVVIAPGGASYRLLAVDSSRCLQESTRSVLRELERRGAQIAWECAGLGQKLGQQGVKPDFQSSHDAAVFLHRDYGEWGEGYFVALSNRNETALRCSFRVPEGEPWLWDPEDGTMAPAKSWQREGGRTTVGLDFHPGGSAFVMFPRASRKDGGGRSVKAKGLRLADPLLVDGAWHVSFRAAYPGAPRARDFERLADWTESDDADVRYFSGTATYEKTIDVADLARPEGARIVLDLGVVREFATVTVNGKGFPALWKPPFRLDVTEACGTGVEKLNLKIEVTNLWPNRMIGDDYLPEDCEWRTAETRQELVRVPAWVREGKDSPTGRKCFTSWKHWDRTDRLLPSGLLGPVVLYHGK